MSETSGAEKLDEDTEMAIGVFELTVRRSVSSYNAEAYDNALNALRFRIRELQQEARKDGRTNYIRNTPL